MNDWKNAFKSFVWTDQHDIEIKNVAMSTFSDCDSFF